MGVCIIALSVSQVLALRNWIARQNEEKKSNHADFQDTVLKTSFELTALISKTSADLRQDLSDRLNQQFLLTNQSLKDDLRQGREELRNGLHQTTQGLENKFSSLEQKLNQRLEDIGKEVQIKLDKNLQDGFSHFQKIQETLVNAEKQLAQVNSVGKSIHDLNQVLNLPHLRGKIMGEGSLERLLNDFLPAHYYALQYQIESYLVDAVVRFEHLNLVLPIDSKFHFEQVSVLFETEALDHDLKTARKKFQELIKQSAKEIKTKYIKPNLGTTDYALMYLPSETLYFEVIRDGALWSSLVEQKVFPVSPNTLAVTIFSIGKSVQYYEMAKNVQKTIQQLHLAKDHLEKFKNRFEEIGDKLAKAQESFQKATSHFNHYTSSVNRLEHQSEKLPDAASLGPSS